MILLHNDECNLTDLKNETFTISIFFSNSRSRNWISSNNDPENDEFVPKDINHGSIRTTVADETQL